MEMMLEIQIGAAMAGAMLLALPVMELALGEGSLPAIYEATALVAGALLIAAVVLLTRLDGERR